MVNLAVLMGGAAINPAKGEPANLAIERCCLRLLFTHNSLVTFALEVQNKPTLTLGRDESMNVHIEAGRYVRVNEAHIIGD